MVNLSFRIVPGKRKSDGGYSIYLAISYNRQTRYINTGLTVTDERHFRNGKACRCRNSAEINSHLCNIMSEFRSRLLKLNLKDYANCTSLKDALLQKPKSTTSAVTLHDLITLRIIRFEKEGRTNYARMHRDSLKVYANFLGNPILSKINRELVSHLTLELLKHDYSNASIQIRLSHLKAALNFAILEGMVKYEIHPFAGITLPSPGRKQTDLTLDEFKKLRDYEFVSNRARFARDMFLISFYLGGINMVDLLEVDLSRDELRYSRKKTRNKKNGDTETIFTIPTVARKIISKHAPNGKLIWPGKRERYDIMISYLNNCFGMLRKETGINPLSYYSARHTFAQFAFEVGTPLEVVEYLLGQSMKTNRPIFNYCRVMKKHADTAIRKIIDYTNESEPT